jgi:TonB family protein
MGVNAVAAVMLALAAPPQADSLETLLREPVGVGNVARLVPHAADARAQERWSAALRDPRADVRATAARAIAVVGARLTKDAVQAALAVEQDPRARRELARATSVFEASVPEAASARPAASMHTADGLWPELVDAVFEAYGCKPPERGVGAAMIEYRHGGRARQVEMIGTELPPACARASSLLLTLALSPEAPQASPRALVVLPLDRDWVACTAEMGAPAPPAGPPLEPLGSQPTAERDGAPDDRRPLRVSRVGGQIQEPRKIKTVPPHYPDSAKAARKQGVVVLEAVIMPSGCVGRLRVLRSVDLALDFAAFYAVSRWRYKPTLLEGQPVPVQMTVTVNFQLN